jgi:glucosyl-3-phosphoglycerate synthase
MSGILSLVITFAIIGYNEEDTAGAVVNLTRAAAGPGDRVLFVDSASTDATAKVAREAGAEVLSGPLGKGAAMAVAARAATTEWICFLDSDLISASRNIASVLRQAIITQPAAHIVGEFDCGLKVVLGSTIAVYEPLVAGLFPEIAGRLGSKPLSGFRAIRRAYVPADLPPDYGVEAHLNIHVAMSGGDSRVVDVGEFTGKIKPHTTMGREIARAVLDAGEFYGRLKPRVRPAWERWVQDVLTVISINAVNDAERGPYLDRLRAAARRPLPAPA